MKLVLWLGGPPVVVSYEYPYQFVAVALTEKERDMFSSIDAKDVDCFLPLEVDE